MCGIAGASTKRLSNANALKLLMIDNEVRGTHSTGLASIKKVNSSGKETKPKLVVLRSTDRASLMIRDAQINGGLYANEVITHTRHATMGEHTTENAHPFTYGDDKDGNLVVGTHNGWLVSWARCSKDLNKFSTQEFCKQMGYKESDFAVDSMLIFHHLSQTNDLQSIADIEGAMALGFLYDNKLNIYRRGSKPLFMIENSQGVYYSSRKEGLEKVFGNESKIVEVPTDIVLQYEKGKKVAEIPITKKIEVEIGEDETPSKFYGRRSAEYRRKNSPPASSSNTGSNTSSSYPSTTMEAYRTRFRTPSGQILDKYPDLHFDASKYRKVNSNVNKYSILNVFDHIITQSETLTCLDYKFEKAEFSDFVFKQAKTPFHEGMSKMIIKLCDSTDKKIDFEGFRICIDGYGETVHVVDENGICAMTVPERLFKSRGQDSAPLKLLIHPPVGYYLKINGKKCYPRKFYYVHLTTEKNGVREVTLRIPFHKQTKEAKRSGTYYPYSDLQFGELAENTMDSSSEERITIPKLDITPGHTDGEGKNKSSCVADCEFQDDPFLSEDAAKIMQMQIAEIFDDEIDTKVATREPDPSKLEDGEANMLHEVSRDLRELVMTCNFAGAGISEPDEIKHAFIQIAAFITAWMRGYPTQYYAENIYELKNDWMEKAQSAHPKGRETFEMIQQQAVSAIGDRCHILYDEVINVIKEYEEEVFNKLNHGSEDD